VHKVPKSPLIEAGLELLGKAAPDIEERDPETGELLRTHKLSELEDPITEQLKGALSPELKELTKEQVEELIAAEKKPTVYTPSEELMAEWKEKTEANMKLLKQLKGEIPFDPPLPLGNMEEFADPDEPPYNYKEIIAKEKAKIEAEAKAKLEEIKKPGDYTLEFLQHVVKGSGGLEDSDANAGKMTLDEYTQHIQEGAGSLPNYKELLQGYVDYITNGNGPGFLKQQADYVIHDDPDSFQGPIYEAPKWATENLPSQKEQQSPNDYNVEWLAEMVNKVAEDESGDATWYAFTNEIEKSGWKFDTTEEKLHEYIEWAKGPGAVEQLAANPENWTKHLVNKLPGQAPATERVGREEEFVREELVREFPDLANFDPDFDHRSMAERFLDRNRIDADMYDEGITAIRDYTDSSYDFNKWLRKGGLDAPDLEPNEWSIRAVTLDEMVDNSRTTNSMLLWRGVGDRSKERISELQRQGLDYVDGGFVSTSVSRRKAAGFGNGEVWPIVVPRGSRALPIEHWSSHGQAESEVLLGRKTRFRIRKTIGGATYLEVVPDVD